MKGNRQNKSLLERGLSFFAVWKKTENDKRRDDFFSFISQDNKFAIYNY
jgi:hypothetical protein